MRRLPLLVATALITLLSPRTIVAQAGSGGGQDETPSNPWTDGLVPGNYLRMSSGSTTPVSPHAALRFWDRGTTYYAGWENWDTGASGVSRLGFSLNAAYSTLPLNVPLFRDTFAPVNGATVTSVSSARAGILEVTSGLRLRMPLPYLMPNLSLGLGLIDWQPGAINYESTMAIRQGPTATPTERRSHGRRGGRKASLRSLRRFRRSPVRLRLHELRQRVRAGRRLQLAGVRHVPQRQHDDRDDSRRPARSRRSATFAHGS